jgi:hypothetical protein
VIRPAFAGLGLALLLAACSQDSGSAGQGAYAGLDQQILDWRADLEAHHVACQTKVEGKGCESFEVTCKAAQDIGQDEIAKGVTAKVVAAMRFNGRNSDGSTGKPGSAFALFSKANGTWTRAESKPVNMSTCAPL